MLLTPSNALSAFLVEIFPYAQRTMGIGIEQIFGKAGGFFSTNVNPIALTAIDWKFFAIYCGWIIFEFLTVFFLYPETYNRTLEELAFCKYHRVEATDVCEACMLTITQCSKTRSWPTSRPQQWRSRSTGASTHRLLARRSNPSRWSGPSKLTGEWLWRPSWSLITSIRLALISVCAQMPLANQRMDLDCSDSLRTTVMSAPMCFASEVIYNPRGNLDSVGFLTLS